MFENFHFIEPVWLLALVPLALIYWLTTRMNKTDSDWNKVIDAHLLPVLLKMNTKKGGRSFSLLLMLAWFIAVLALANPAWEKRFIPVFQTDFSRVLVLDLSRSMDIPDLKPSRLQRAKFKIEDILRREDEGQLGLVVFAGDAFTVTPLTRDADTISSLLSSLHSAMMPAQGSRADLGLLKAQELLEQAGITKGQVLLIADGAEASSALSAAKQLQEAGHTISVLGVGTTEGAPIPGVRDQTDKPIVVPMQEEILKEIAQIGGGRYSTLQSTNTDIDYLMASQLGSAEYDDATKAEQSDDLQQDWKSQGPLLVLLLIPLAALAFRRGWLLSVSLLVITLGQPQPVMASVWDGLWQRQDQQADQALQRGDYEQAEQLSVDPLRRGSAAYKKGDYQNALNDFSVAKGADAAYNKGNALAQLQKYEAAISAYNDALKLQPDMQDAKDNKAKIEELLKNQQQQQKQQDQQSQQKDSEQQEDQKKSDQQSDSQKNPSDSQDKEEGQADGQNQKDKNQFAKANEEQEKKENEKKAEERNKTEQQKKEEEQAAQAEKEQEKRNSQQQQNVSGQAAPEENDRQVEAEALNNEEKIAAEQWLRRIQDDPGELLKRKFKYQYNRRNKSTPQGTPW